ncbi:MAG: tRNA (adenosine(37)-N6)-threonylcarbamoyltransferase complex dimerization subunit type 1 TsaB [Gammaproteobacteria bacterium]|nr:tRNA (adenosine(37)-N6)-threonylcarbamoyltransferase complex dimerization subunit type 1 TsaB [Gammaproteobacteria bacterium]MBT4654246.1 tRNA (adenosine(37)-N6)-threonylcarbamoyltransferase complex dimerization subunit type 1 TsaB [Gammaproteobacteria bacterium]MBT5116774.1 tRNA (adenosine(37)-N6)-threonylcarbamoyltransferase complex dimerization subunit type 1 TsaB [Gammaproteobacteria bacterium]MBT5761151.1 tRNA (adenosine(37)-N6)-threonylcarbamoyltransferase complex dimerization subunit t
MNILSIDSSGPVLSLTLKQNDKIFSYSDVQEAKASQIILSSIDSLLLKSKINVTDLNAIVFNKGPASFTGTRVAASVCQAIGYSRNIPVIGISSLSLMAFNYFLKSNYSYITCIKKAYSDKFYVGQFDVNNNEYETINPISLCGADQFKFDKTNHYVSDSWDKIVSLLGNDVLKDIHNFNDESSLNSEILLKYAEKYCEFGNSFDLKKTFPDYANHVINV